MFSTTAKENLIQIIADELLERFMQKKVLHKLVTTSKNACPVQTKKGISKKHADLESMFDEVDYLLPRHVVSC